MSKNESILEPLVAPIQGPGVADAGRIPALQLSRRLTNPNTRGGIRLWFDVLSPDDERAAAHLQSPPEALTLARNSITYVRGSTLDLIEFTLPNLPTTIAVLNACRDWMNGQNLTYGRPETPEPLAQSATRMNDPKYWENILSRDPKVSPWLLNTQTSNDDGYRVAQLTAIHHDVGISAKEATYRVYLPNLVYAAAQLLVAHTIQQAG